MTVTTLPGRPVHARSGGPAGGPGAPADTPGDLLREAWRPGTAEPVAIHVRPELCARLLRSRRTRPRSCPAAGPFPPRRIPLLVDDRIPAAPGFEVHRVPPGAATGGLDLLGARTDATGAAGGPLLVLDPSGDCSCTAGPRDRAGDAADPQAGPPVPRVGGHR
ncbi:hypothetical protein [Geodermatophilus sp. SYSU D01176]